MSNPNISREEMESMLPAEEQERIRKQRAESERTLERLSVKVSELAAKVREEEHRPCRERIAALTAEVAAMRQSRDAYERLINHDGSLSSHAEMLDVLADAMKALNSINAVVVERDALQRHYDAASPEHNLLALLDRYHERAVTAESALREAVEALEGIIYASDQCQGHRNCGHSMEPWKQARAVLSLPAVKALTPPPAGDRGA